LRPEFVVRLRLFNIFKAFGRGAAGICLRLAGSRQGNIALTFGLVAMPLLLGVGISIDYVRAYNTRVKMQSDLDAALIASVKKVGTLNDDQIKQEVANWFAAQASDNQASYKLLLDNMVISKTNQSIQAIATGVMPTTFLGLANIPSINVSVVTTVAGPAASYLNVYIVLDKSASMLLAATSAGQAAMRNYSESSCVFACHDPEGNSNPYNGVVYSTNYALAKAMGVQLRADVSVSATKKVLDLITAADPTHSNIKVGLYSIGSDATEVLAPTTSMTTAEQTLNSPDLTSETSEPTTHFETSLGNLTNMVGEAGDGSTSNNPRKLVLILTDGVQSERVWVNGTEAQHALTSPLNPGWCSGLKTAGATVGMLYTQYLPMTWDGGYNRTVGQSMRSSDFTSEWGGTIREDVDSSITRLDYIPYALQDCASSSELFISAAAPSDIENGLSSLFDTYLSSVRLTQ
jgi:Flp pilus assembly protein TadG